MKIITLNVNGIRSAAKKGFFEWFAAQNADVICLQEIKAEVAQLSDPIFTPPGYHAFFYSAEKKGYAGVALYTRQKPVRIKKGLGIVTADQDGRYLQVDFEQFSVASIYLPSGSSGPDKQARKFLFMEQFTPQLQAIRQQNQKIILCGDWNIAHKEIDLKNWRANQKNSGFLPEERSWLDHVFNDLGFVDAFRVCESAPLQYTWWSNRGQAWAKNVGWRIDYQIITPDLRAAVKAAHIYKDHRFSDHAPLTIDFAE